MVEAQLRQDFAFTAACMAVKIPKVIYDFVPSPPVGVTGLETPARGAKRKTENRTLAVSIPVTATFFYKKAAVTGCCIYQGIIDLETVPSISILKLKA